ncbi:MAG: serine hydrolase domain-containing protein [Gemmatimonadota bacterium]
MTREFARSRTSATRAHPTRPPVRLVVCTALFAATAFAALSCAPSSEGEFSYIPASRAPGSPADLGLSGYAKVMCSAIYVSGRDPEEAVVNSGYFLVPEDILPAVRGPFIDPETGIVRMVYADTLSGAARYMGDQGCVLLPPGRDRPYFGPVPVRTTLPPADSMDWPMGDRTTPYTPPPGVDTAGIREAVDLAFADSAGLTQAFIVVHRGRIVGERYAPGVDKDTQLESWSMGKSLTATLVGLLIRDGEFSLDDPAPVPLWHEDPDDPRGAIRISHLLQMSSGLHFIAPRDPDYGPGSPYPDHMAVYTKPLDVFRFSIDRPLQFPPGTEGRYRNSDPLTLGYIIREKVRARGEEYLTYPQRALFDRIGIRKQVLETDPYGNFVLTGFDYGTARNWARLGMLYLQDGVWEGDRLLPEGFVDFVRTPAPAWKEPVYGGLFWVNGDSAWALPRDAYFMAGGGGQRAFIVPSHDLVVVRLGHFRGNTPGMAALNRALARLMEAVGG